VRRGLYLFANGANADSAAVAFGIPPTKSDGPLEGSPDALRIAVKYWKVRAGLSSRTFGVTKEFLKGRGSFQGPNWVPAIWGANPKEPLDCLKALAKIARRDREKLAKAQKAVADAGLREVLTPAKLNRRRAAGSGRQRGPECWLAARREPDGRKQGIATWQVPRRDDTWLDASVVLVFNPLRRL